MGEIMRCFKFTKYYVTTLDNSFRFIDHSYINNSLKINMRCGSNKKEVNYIRPLHMRMKWKTTCEGYTCSACKLITLFLENNKGKKFTEREFLEWKDLVLNL